MSYSEETTEAVDKALRGLLCSTRGRNASQGLVMIIGARAARPWALRARLPDGALTAFGHWVLERWDGVCDET